MSAPLEIGAVTLTPKFAAPPEKGISIDSSANAVDRLQTCFQKVISGFVWRYVDADPYADNWRRPPGIGLRDKKKCGR